MAEVTTGVRLGAQRRRRCERCGEEFDCSPKGVLPKACKPCQRKLRAEYTRAWRGVKAEPKPDLCCCDCGAGIERKPGRGASPKRCRLCAAERDREHVREWRSRQPPAATECACVECNTRFLRKSMDGPVPKRCPQCTAERARRLSREYQRSARLHRYLQTGRLSNCERCLAQISLARKGPRTQFCQPCRKAVRIETYWAARGKNPDAPIACGDCGTAMTLHRKGTSRRRCSDCAAARQRRQSKAWWSSAPRAHRAAKWRQQKHRRRAAKRGASSERFNDRDVFIRDRWICQICGNKIDPAAKYPDPRSASLDHIVPLSQGGSHTRANTRLACWICNSLRGNRGGNEQLALIG